MSNKMSFHGGYIFKTELELKDAVYALEATAITEKHMQLVSGTTMRIRCDTTGPSPLWETTVAALRDISRTSTRGYCNAQFDPGRGEAAIVRNRYHSGGNIEHMKGPFPADDDG